MKREVWITGLSVTLVAGIGVALLGVSGLKNAAKGVRDQWRESQQRSLANAAILQGTMEAPQRADAPQLVYNAGKLGEGWQDWSWGQRDLSAALIDAPHPIIKFSPKNFEGLYLHRDPIALEGYGTLEFRIKQSGNNYLKVALAKGDNQFAKAVFLKGYWTKATAEKNGWRSVRIPLADLGIRAPVLCGGIVFQCDTKEAQPAVYLDAIRLLPDDRLPPPPTAVTVGVTVDTGRNTHTISPFIYGMAFAPEKYCKDLRLALNRWGGNDKSRYNWVDGNAVNAARDWEFRNRVVEKYLPPGPSSAANAFIDQNRNAGTTSLLTIPTLGWVAKNADNNVRSEGVPNQGDMPLPGSENDGVQVKGYNATGNRQKTSVRSVAKKGKPFSKTPNPNAPIAQDEWVWNLMQKYGTASKNGVKFYAMDNEPDLWSHTHTDLVPGHMGYDQMLSRFLEYADAVKDVDPTALVTGPVSWGWTGYLYSPKDRGSDNFRTAADRKAHGGKPFLPWFLSAVKAHDARRGRRTLDVLDVHYYPQADLYNQKTDTSTNARRLRAVQSLWNDKYPDESWIGEPVRLIPRLKEWIKDNYPGTQLGITEWNFGADQHINGALAIAETLGVYGREGVDMACYWAYPNENSPGYLAFKLLRNPDDAGHGMGDTSCLAQSAMPLQVSSYAALDSKTGDLTLLLVNKLPKATATVPITFAQAVSGQPVHYWRLAATTEDGKKAAIITGTLAGEANRLTVTLPPYSATLLRIPTR